MSKANISLSNNPMMVFLGAIVTIAKLFQNSEPFDAMSKNGLSRILDFI
jgi:hypothetical protein